jgi:hypothetical protein
MRGSARAYDENQVVLLYPAFDLDAMNYGVAKLQMGYPWDLSRYLDVVNPLDNSVIASHFEDAGKLVR